MSNFTTTPFLGTQDPSSNFSTYHPLTRRYVLSLGETPTDINRIEQFIRALDSANLLENLVDGCLMSTGQNISSGAALKTLMGNSATLVGSPVIGNGGMQLDGSTQYATFPLTDTRIGSSVVAHTGVTSGQTSFGCVFSKQNATYGYSGNASSSQFALMFSASAYGNIWTNQSATLAASDIIADVSFNAICFHPTNPQANNYILTTDNAVSPTLKAYVNGKLLVTDSTGNTQNTTAQDRIVIGARIDNLGIATVLSKGLFPFWLQFNKVFSDTEAAAVDAACRWLDPKPRNILFAGDSLTAYDPTKSTNSWAYQYQKSDVVNNARYINIATNGLFALTLNPGYNTAIKPFRPYVNGVTGGADLFLCIGTNDIFNGFGSAATWIHLQQLWAKARADGFVVHASTLPKGTGFGTGAIETERQALNALIIANPELYDSLFRPDLLFPDPADTTFYLDTLHLKPLGNVILANARAAAQQVSKMNPKAVPLTDAATIATDASLVPEDGVCYVTLAGNRTLGNPTNPTQGQQIVYRLIQDATGSRTITLDTKFRAGPITVTLPVAANATAYLRVMYNLAADKWDVLDFRQPY